MITIWKAATAALTPVFRPAGNSIPGITPGDWASPQNPIQAIQHAGVDMRTWDFTPGINLQFTPRGDQSITFAQLWRLSNSFDLCRLMIETRKDQIVNRPWQISVGPKDGETKKARLQRQAGNPDVAFLSALFKKPDGYHTFDIWLRTWLEQLLVFDAPCIHPVKNVLGDILNFRVISGATITPLVDNTGFTPMPPAPAFQQIILGSITSTTAATSMPTPEKNPEKFKPLTVDQLVYRPRNPRVDSRWGFGPVEQIITTLAIAANFQQFARDAYESGNVPEGFLPMPESWTAQQIKDFQTWFDSLLAGNLARKRRMIMIPATEKGAQFSKESLIVNPVVNEYVTRVIAYAFSVTPQNLIKQVNRGTAKESTDVAQIEGLEPYLKHIENVMDELIQIVRPGSDCIFRYQDEQEMDPLKAAQTEDLKLRNGSATINGTREDRGDDPFPGAQFDVPYVYTATGMVLVGEQAQPAAGPDDGPDDAGTRPVSEKYRKRAPMRAKAGDLTPKSRQAKNDARRILVKFLGDQGRSVAKQACAELTKQRKLGMTKGDTETDAERALAILAAIEFSYPELYKELLPYFQTAAEEGVREGAFQAAANAGASLKSTLEAAVPTATAAAKARAAEMVGLKVEDDGTIAEATGAHWAISTTAKDDVLNAIKQAIKENWKPDQLEAVIQASTVFEAEHGDMIADNEISRQQANGHLTAWSASGAVLEYRWDVVADCCDFCRGFAEQGSVPVGHEFAPMIYAPGAHPFCRCWLTATKFREDE